MVGNSDATSQQQNAATTGPSPSQGLGLPPWISRGSVLMVMLAVVAPAAIPVLVFGLPVLALVTVWRMKVRDDQAKAEAEAEAPQLVEMHSAKEGGKSASVKKDNSPAGGSVAAAAAASSASKAPDSDAPPLASSPTPTPDPTTGTGAGAGATLAPPPPTTTAPRAAVGGAAILAKLRAAKAQANEKGPSDHPIVVTYASQTGTAAEVAKNIGSSINSEGLTSNVVPMNELGLVSGLSRDKTPFIIYVASSTGDGEAPDNATRFYNDLRNKNRNEPGALRGIKFTGLGLGDSNYTRFMHVPRVVKNRFLELGATEFHPCVEADEVDGIEEIIDGWIEKLMPAVKAAVSDGRKESEAPVRSATKDMALPACGVEVVWIDEGTADHVGRDVTGDDDVAVGKTVSAASPFQARISDARYLTTSESDADRRVVHVQFDLAGSGIEYGPGDSLAVLPENDAALVDALLSHLGLDGSKRFAIVHKGEEAVFRPSASPVAAPRPLQHIKWPCSIREAFLHGIDLTGPPKKSLLRVLAEHCSDPAEKAALMRLCSREGRQEYMETVLKAPRAFIDVLFENDSCKPPLDALLDALPPLAPRMYSISSAPSSATGSDKAEVAFTAVEYPTVSGGTRKGVATWWLENKALPLDDKPADADKRVPLYLRKGGSFSPPGSVLVPWIMIGPGTGVSPFRGFLQQRRTALSSSSSSSSPADCWLFFGCRDKAKDYLYGDELEGLAADGTLTKLCVAESRKNPDKKVYVQHLMLQHKDRLRELIVEQDAFVFICGDGHGMAKDVHNALVEIISSGDGADAMDAAEAEAMLKDMTRSARYVKDVWS